MHKWLSKSSIYKKITITFISILLLTGLFCTAIYIHGRSVIKSEISQGIQDRNKNAADSLYNTCQQIRMMQYQFGGYDDLIDLIVIKDRGETGRENTIISHIQDSLLTIWKGNSILEDVVLISPTSQQTISTGYAWPFSEAEERLIEYYQATQTSGSLFEYEGKTILMSDYLLGEYYIYAELNLGTFIRNLQPRDDKTTNQCFLYNSSTQSTIGPSSTDTVMAILNDGGWQSIIRNPADQNGYLIHAAEVNRSEYICVTYNQNNIIYRSLNIFRNIYIGLLLLLFVSGIFFITRIFEMVHRPLQVLTEGLEEIKAGNLETEITIQRKDEFQLIYNSFNNMTRQLRQLIDKNYRQEILLQKSELKQLQAQIAPHFLYNSFITLSNRINAEEYEFAAEFSSQLGQYFMFMTRNGREYLPLKEEMGHACIYAKIQQTRFRNRIHMQLEELDPSWEQIIVPRLVIQPVFENVFKYAVERSAGMTELHMGINYGDEYLDIYIENSGEITAEELDRIRRQLPETGGEIHGMANVYQRLQLIYGETAGLTLEKSELGGLKVTIRLLKEIPGGKGNVQTAAGR